MKKPAIWKGRPGESEYFYEHPQYFHEFVFLNLNNINNHGDLNDVLIKMKANTVKYWTCIPNNDINVGL